MSSGEMKYQFNLFCGQQSYIFRTNSKAEALKFCGTKLGVETVVPFLQGLHLQMGTYDIPIKAKQPKEKIKETSLSFKEQLKAKAKGKELKKIEKMTEKQAQTELFKKLRGNR